MLVVFGSINIDMMMPVPHFPQPGETLLCNSYDWLPGGKGMNQAVAAARAGAKVAMIGRVGNDGFGTRALNTLKREGVMVSGIGIDDSLPTGCACVMVDPHGENQIVVAVGANDAVTGDQVPNEVLNDKNIVLFQMELPIERTMDVLLRADKGGATTILNLAPAHSLPHEALDHLDYLIVNRIEAEQIARRMGLEVNKDAMKLAHAIALQFKLTCIITLSSNGSVASDGLQGYKVPTMKMDQVIDTTGSGDCYCGVFAASLHKGYSLPEAMRMASVAGALSVRAAGAQTAMPIIDDILHHLPSLPQAELVAL